MWQEALAWSPGLVLPWVFFTDFMSTHGFNVFAFVGALFGNGASAGVTVDVVISSFVFWIYMFSKEGPAKPWPFIAVNLAVGLSCALPLYLFFTTPKHAAV